MVFAACTKWLAESHMKQEHKTRHLSIRLDRIGCYVGVLPSWVDARSGDQAVVLGKMHEVYLWKPEG